MHAEPSFVVKVGKGFVSISGTGKRLITYAIRNARRFSKSDAMNMAALATTAFPKEEITIARENHPDRAYNVDDPSEYVVAIGRQYLRGFRAGQAQTTYALELADRQTRLDARDLVDLLSGTFIQKTIYAAHEDSPFIPIAFADRTAEDPKPDDDRRDASEE